EDVPALRPPRPRRPGDDRVLQRPAHDPRRGDVRLPEALSDRTAESLNLLPPARRSVRGGAILLLTLVALSAARAGPGPAAPFEPSRIPGWVNGVTRMAFLTPGELDAAAKAG